MDEEGNRKYDSIHPQVQQKRPGYSKMLAIEEFKLILLDSYNQVSAIELNHPFLRFFIYLQAKLYEQSFEELKGLEEKTYFTIFSILQVRL